MARNGPPLRIFARILPREFRERVFEPALLDLQLDERSLRAGRWARWASRVILIAESLRLGVPQFAWRRRRPTRLAAVLLVAIAVAALVVQRAKYGERSVHRHSGP